MLCSTPLPRPPPLTGEGEEESPFCSPLYVQARVEGSEIYLNRSPLGVEVRQPVPPGIAKIVGELGAPHLCPARKKPVQSLGPLDRILQGWDRPGVSRLWVNSYADHRTLY